MRILPCGFDGALIEFSQRISPSIHRRTIRFSKAIEDARILGVLEVVPSYCSLLLRYDPLLTEFAALAHQIRALKRQSGSGGAPEGPVRYIPVRYGGDAGPDLIDSAKACVLSPEQLIATHLSKTYRVYAIGFLPGFPYLGLLPKSLSLPRLEIPRKRVTKGSVAIASRQTGIYPRESPGGWRLIGQTPFELFCETEDPPTLLQTGDRVRFVAIDGAEDEAIRRRVSQGNWMRFEREWRQGAL